MKIKCDTMSKKNRKRGYVMRYTIPDYYKEFQCTADKCEDTCCAGWQIVIDDKSLRKYKKVRGKFAPRMFCSVNWLNKTFRQDKEKRCAFLNEENLCDLYINQGADSLCKTCRLYPRHIEEFEGLREISLSVSCPEVAKILMNHTEPVKFITYEKEGDEEYEDFDPFLFSILEDAKEVILEILQNRELPVRNRALLILGMAHDMQGRLNRQELFSCGEVIDKYCGENAKSYVEEFLAKETTAKKADVVTPKMFKLLYEMEFLKENWYPLLKETEAILYEQKKRPKETPDWEIYLEQLLVYFVSTYFLGAVYDGEVYSKVQMAVYASWMVHQLWTARWIQNDESIDLEEMIDLLYRFSREVEHSDINLKRLEKLMQKNKIL